MDTTIEDDINNALYTVRGVREILTGNLMYFRECEEVCHVIVSALNEAESDLTDALARIDGEQE